MSSSVKRLFRQFQPQKYTLDITVDPAAMTFEGSVIIDGQRLGRPSQRLTFHQNNLTLRSAVITKHDKKGEILIEVDRINNHNKFDEVRLHTKTMLYPGHYTVKLKFCGKITKAMNGIYPCFFELKGKQQKLIATQFESHHAREVFPCIDEPEAKAIFELTLSHPSDDIALSNTPIRSEEHLSKGLVTKTVFEPTPKMSTYLLAFVLGELGYKEAKTKDGVIIRTYATPDNVEHTTFALEVAVKCLEFYNDYFGISYPLPKCDLIALPDFASGAMENWGCITFREATLLVDPKNSTLANKQYVALVIAHELTHQWFGNLVTMRWWTDLWLNEGFASWMEYLAVDHIFPEWNVWTQFIVDEQQQALKLDALEYTHPIEVAVNHPDEIRTIFDAISYSKGASVIHMLHQYLGSDIFRDGLRHYLNKHKYCNTDTVDLWASLEEVSGKPVRKFMNAWTSQSGFPLVTATVTGKHVQLEQKRFYINPQAKNKGHELWPIPLLAGNRALDALSVKSNSFELPDANTVFKLNAGQSGLYRVAYNKPHLELLGKQITESKLLPQDRLGILSDLFEAAKAGSTSTADALEFISHFKAEDDYAVWDTLTSALGNVRLIMDDEPLRDNMKPFIKKLVSMQLKRLGWNRNKNDSHFDMLLRPIILGLAASADHTEIVEHCRTLFDSINTVEDVSPDLRATASSRKVKRGFDIDPDLRGIVFGTMARLGGEAEFNKLLHMHYASSLSEERVTIAAALTGFQQPKLINKSLSLIMTDNVRLQDVSYWIAYSFLNRFARAATWKWLKSNWQWLEENLGTDLAFYRMPIYAARVHSDPRFIPEYEKFFKAHLSPAFERPYNQGMEMLEYQTAWKQRSLKEVITFFNTQNS